MFFCLLYMLRILGFWELSTEAFWWYMLRILGLWELSTAQHELPRIFCIHVFLARKVDTSIHTLISSRPDYLWKRTRLPISRRASLQCTVARFSILGRRKSHSKRGQASWYRGKIGREETLTWTMSSCNDSEDSARTADRSALQAKLSRALTGAAPLCWLCRTKITYCLAVDNKFSIVLSAVQCVFGFSVFNVVCFFVLGCFRVF